MKPFIAITLSLLWCAPAHAGDGMPCATTHEKIALDMRALQSDLMVAALTCEMRKEYNAFVRDYAKILPNFGKSLRAYFNRIYRSNAESKLDRFVTRMAGSASLHSLKTTSSNYCAGTRKLYKTLKDSADHPEDIAAVYSDRHSVKFCTDYAQAEIRALYANLVF